MRQLIVDGNSIGYTENESKHLNREVNVLKLLTKLLIAFLAPTLFFLAGLKQPVSAVDDLVPGGPASTPEQLDTATPKFALLVGVDKYANLKPSEQLNGCVNDVGLMRNLLKERFGFLEDQIVTLTDEQATGAAIREQLSAIVRQLDALPAVTNKPQVMFHFSGHGSQVADQQDGINADEADGLDETLVPHDATKQGGNEDIRDDELFDFVQKICGDGRANMWLVLDACHSGSGARGVTKIRQLNRQFDRGPSSERVGSVDQYKKTVTARRLPAGAILLSACRAREVEPEYQQGDKSYGLLTCFLTQVLNERTGVSSLRYDVLREAIVSRYQRDPSVSQAPVPQLEGDSALMSASVLGSSGINRPAYWQVERNGSDRGKLLVRAGSLHGVSVGSIYEIYKEPENIVWNGALNATGNNGESSCWLRIHSVTGATATGNVFQWVDDTPVDQPFQDWFTKGYAVERFHQHGDFGIRVRVVNAIDENSDGPALISEKGELPQFVKDALHDELETGEKRSESAWLHLSGDDETCDFLLRIDGNYAAIFPATGFAHVDSLAKTRGDIPVSLRGGWGPIDLRNSAKATEELRSYLRRITRARNLIRIAAEQSGAGMFGNESSSKLSVDIELMKIELDDKLEVVSAVPWQPDAEGTYVMHDMADYAFRVSNPGRSPEATRVYVTILQIDPNMGIDAILPHQESNEISEDQKLLVGEERTTVVFTSNYDASLDPSDPDYEPPVYGKRTLVVLVTSKPSHFYMLQQQSLPVVRGSGPTRIAPNGATRDTNAEPDSLESILLQQMYFQSRGDSRRRPQKLYDDTWSARTMEWLVVPDTALYQAKSKR